MLYYYEIFHSTPGSGRIVYRADRGWRVYPYSIYTGAVYTSNPVHSNRCSGSAGATGRAQPNRLSAPGAGRISDFCLRRRSRLCDPADIWLPPFPSRSRMDLQPAVKTFKIRFPILARGTRSRDWPVVYPRGRQSMAICSYAFRPGQTIGNQTGVCLWRAHLYSFHALQKCGCGISISETEKPRAAHRLTKLY